MMTSAGHSSAKSRESAPLVSGPLAIPRSSHLSRPHSILMDTELQSASSSPSSAQHRLRSLARRVLALLLDLTNLPAKQVDINEFFVPSMADKPPVLAGAGAKGASEGTKKKTKSAGGATAAGGAPDWMAYYDSSDEEEEAEPTDPGKKRKRREGASSGVGKGSMWAQVWSVHSHKKAFTSAWLALLSLP